MNSADCLMGKMKRKRLLDPQVALIVYLLHLEQCRNEAYSDSLSANCRRIGSHRETGFWELCEP